MKTFEFIIKYFNKRKQFVFLSVCISLTTERNSSSGNFSIFEQKKADKEENNWTHRFVFLLTSTSQVSSN